jgi:methionyl-tRNA formyltransferase
MGTGDISATSLARVVAEGHELPLVVTRPDRPRGRSGKPAPPPVKVLALEHGLAIAQPERIGEALERVGDLAPEAIVVVAFNQLLPPEMLSIPRHGCINVHLSLLPRYRGAAPIQHAIRCGDTVTGVTVMRMAEKFDTGPILRTRELAIGEHETTGELSPRLAALGADLLAEVLRDLEAGPIEGVPQDPALASRAPLLRKEHGRLDWSLPAESLRNLVRAMTPWPSAYTSFLPSDGGTAIRLILLETRAEAGRDRTEPGTVLAASPEGLVVAAGEETALRILRLQRSGKRPVDVRSFLNGCPVRPGDRMEAGGGGG